MKNLGLLLITALLTLSFNSDESDCNSYYPIHKGMRWVNNHYNAKGKLQSASELNVVNETATADGIEYTFNAKPYDDKKDTASVNFSYLCDGNILKIDMNKMFPQEMLKSANETMEIKINQIELEFPSEMAVGSQLKEANINVVMTSNGMKIMDIKMKIFDRKVVSSEQITTPSGTYDCLKLSSKTNLSWGFMNQTTSSLDWISNTVGTVRSEQYDKKGKLSGYSELVEYSK